MAISTFSRIAIAVIGALSLAACGGGGGGERPATGFTPAPPLPPPPPPPPPASPPPVPAGPTGVVSNAPFVAVAGWSDGWGTSFASDDQVAISYSPTDGRYTLTLPGSQPAQLDMVGGSGSIDGQGNWATLNSTYNHLVRDGQAEANVDVSLDHPSSSPYSYTSFGGWVRSCPMGCESGVFAYGIPTAAGDVPVTGSADYIGTVRGATGNGAPVSGSVILAFDFGAGELSGAMSLEYYPVWDAVQLGSYTFRDTVYSPGSTSFSGAFVVPGGYAGPSWFAGNFTGPGAVELLAAWQAPYFDTATQAPGSMSGVWVARR